MNNEQWTMNNGQCIMLNKKKKYEKDITTVIYVFNYKHLLTRY